MHTIKLRRTLTAVLTALVLSVPLAACTGGDAIPDEHQQPATEEPGAPPVPGDDEGETGERVEADAEDGEDAS
jgi:hypothetical protein